MWAYPRVQAEWNRGESLTQEESIQYNMALLKDKLGHSDSEIEQS